MASASFDENSSTTLTGALNTTGATVVKVKVNASTHALKCSDGTTGTDYGPTNALRDDNDYPTLIATSSSDGTTPIVIYADSSGNLLIQST